MAANNGGGVNNHVFFTRVNNGSELQFIEDYETAIHVSDMPFNINRFTFLNMFRPFCEIKAAHWSSEPRFNCSSGLNVIIYFISRQQAIFAKNLVDQQCRRRNLTAAIIISPDQIRARNLQRLMPIGSNGRTVYDKYSEGCSPGWAAGQPLHYNRTNCAVQNAAIPRPTIYICVDRLEINTTKAQLIQFFRSYGVISHIDFWYGLKHRSVQYLTAEIYYKEIVSVIAAAKSAHNLTLNSRHIRVSVVIDQEHTPEHLAEVNGRAARVKIYNGDTNYENLNRLWPAVRVKNLMYGTTHDNVHQLFSPHGTIKRIEISDQSTRPGVPKSLMADIYYESEAGADASLHMNNIILNFRELYVQEMFRNIVRIPDWRRYSPFENFSNLVSSFGHVRETMMVGYSMVVTYSFHDEARRADEYFANQRRIRQANLLGQQNL